MNNRMIRNVIKDSVILAFFAGSTATLVVMLGLNSPNLAPALLVLAMMTPLVCSAAVQLKRDISRELEA